MFEASGVLESPAVGCDLCDPCGLDDPDHWSTDDELAPPAADRAAYEAIWRGWLGLDDQRGIDCGDALDGGRTASAPELAAEFGAESAEVLDERDLVGRIVGFDRIIAWAQAAQAAAIAELAGRRLPVSEDPAVDRGGPGGCSEYFVHELSAMLRISPSAAYLRLRSATTLSGRLVRTRQAWQDGEIDLARVLTMIEETQSLTAAQARAVEEHCLPKAPEQTAAQLRRSLRRAALAVDADATAARHRRAHSERRVVLYPADNGMADLVATLPADQARLAYLTLSEIARTATESDDRSADARRADALVHLLTCADPAGVPADERGNTGTPAGRATRAQLLVTVAGSTLLGLDDDPGELAGYGPIPASLARLIATDSTWRRLIVDPDDGTVQRLDRLSYRPGRVLGDQVRARDVRCRFPTCNRAATDAGVDLDHGIAWPHGPTAATNLTAKCRSHHRLKTHGWWKHRQEPDGTVRWTSPTGQVYADPLPAALEPVPRTAAPPSRPGPRSSTELALDGDPPY